LNLDENQIRTARLTLRRFRTEDAPALHEIMRDPETMKFWSTEPHASLAQTEEFVGRTIAACDAGESDDFVVLLDGEIVGNAGLWQGDEIGFVFARSVWGTGVAREAIEEVLAHAFARGVTKIRADVDPRNERSLRLLKKLGFVETGTAKQTYHIGDEWTDSVYLEKRAD
jgi:ribosomal-protein-alanine N-acetyltransferase